MRGERPLDGSPALVELVRSGLVESVHHGAAVVLDRSGEVVAEAGDIDSPYFMRSSLKPMQAVGMVLAGLDSLSAAELAIVAASHSGAAEHVELVRTMLAAGDLTEDDLGCPPDLPLGRPEKKAMLAAGGKPSKLVMNCSGKHTGMLRTCQVAGWSTDGYRRRAHPLQEALAETTGDLVGEFLGPTGVDGCGAPAMSCSLRGLATGFVRLVEAREGSTERTVADAMRAHPEIVGGEGRMDTRLMRAVPGLLAKEGAEGVFVAAVSGLGAVAVKIADGSNRARPPVMISGLRRLGLGDGTEKDLFTELAGPPVYGGGERVGAMRAIW